MALAVQNMKPLVILPLILILVVVTDSSRGNSSSPPGSSNERQIKRAPRIPIVGCYSDTVLIENDSLVVGNGFLKIRRLKIGMWERFRNSPATAAAHIRIPTLKD